MKRVISNLGQWIALTMLVTKRFEKNKKPFMITIAGAPKTHEQLGYLHAEVLPKLTIALFDAGYIKANTERYAKYWLKRQIGYGEWINISEIERVFDGDSFSDAKIETLMQAIDTAIDTAQHLGVYIAPPRINNARKAK